MTRAALGKLLLLVAGLVLGGLLLREIGAAPGTEWVDRYVRDQGLLGETLFVLAGAAATAAGMPRQAVAFLGGYAFGAALGLALALLATLLGCAGVFFWARAVGQGWVERRLAGRFGPRLRPMVGLLRENAFGATLALRLFPVGSNLALNLLAGMAGVAAAPFLLASALGYLPQTLVFALLGKGVRVDGAWQMALSAALLAGSIGLGLWLMRRHRAGRTVEAGEAAPR
ncbi:TVP38/TMEM64 family protein [Rubritepida flocculans]|uniref:TVP38/TMEM64 family protein n=1 Tax=Rubritepida flocculans TaxID=182403 RepID=UPI0004177D06|nr:VTT domain-containing protein [Rubritepida flocculans]